MLSSSLRGTFLCSPLGTRCSALREGRAATGWKQLGGEGSGPGAGGGEEEEGEEGGEEQGEEARRGGPRTGQLE